MNKNTPGNAVSRPSHFPQEFGFKFVIFVRSLLLFLLHQPVHLAVSFCNLLPTVCFACSDCNCVQDLVPIQLREAALRGTLGLKMLANLTTCTFVQRLLDVLVCRLSMKILVH